jgi:hypothetical protein
MKTHFSYWADFTYIHERARDSARALGNYEHQVSCFLS